MEDSENNGRQEIYSRSIRAGKRTYFLDVKSTRSDDYYLTITESKRRFDAEQGKFFYEKHKVFLYKEDFDKFTDGLNEVIGYIRSGKFPPKNENIDSGNEYSDINFDDLNDNSPDRRDI
jgi:hypothetical protein